jgi:hypothetical protein
MFCNHGDISSCVFGLVTCFLFSNFESNDVFSFVFDTTSDRRLFFFSAAPWILVLSKFHERGKSALFAWLISHQPAVLFSHIKPATSNQPAVLFSQNKPAPAISHQPTEQAAYLGDTRTPSVPDSAYGNGYLH